MSENENYGAVDAESPMKRNSCQRTEVEWIEEKLRFARLKEAGIKETKELRVLIDSAIQRVKEAMAKPGGFSQERETSLLKLREAVMWLGMDLKQRGAENPYPNSYKPENCVVDPTADGLKL